MRFLNKALSHAEWLVEVLRFTKRQDFFRNFAIKTAERKLPFHDFSTINATVPTKESISSAPKLMNPPESTEASSKEPVWVTKTSTNPREEGWDLIGSHTEWGEWSETTKPLGLSNTEVYQVEVVREAETKKQYLYYNWWYFKDNVKMFSTDDNDGTIPKSQYWEEWYDYTMESQGWQKKYNSEDQATYWETPQHDDIRYLKEEREVEIMPAVYRERRGTIIYEYGRLE